ncbi:hypothetical protein [Pseudomonas sp. NPDC089534]|uniref:hypothetical protein n=1 Tax=Pseudomonas sp. NPDC089534 TaxID=3364468 RepID=UPI0037FDCBEB
MTGYYHEYAHSMAQPGNVHCALVSIQDTDGHLVYERVERLASERSGQTRHVRYEGVIYYLGDRLYLIDYESAGSSEINQTILAPSFKHQHPRLNGLKLGVTACDRRTPLCARVVWDSLGPDINRTEAFRRVKEYSADDQDLDADLKTRLSQGHMMGGMYRMS